MSTIALPHSAYDYYLDFCQQASKAKLTDGWIFAPKGKHKAFALSRLLALKLIKSKSAGQTIMYAKTDSTATVVLRDKPGRGRPLGSKTKLKTEPLQSEALVTQYERAAQNFEPVQPISRGRNIPTIWQWVDFIKAFTETSASLNASKANKLENDMAQWTLALGAAVNNDERHRAIRELARLDNEMYDIGSRRTIDAIKTVAAKPEFRNFKIDELVSLDPDRYVSL